MKDEIRYYLRFHPGWYLILSRYPERYYDLMDEIKDSQHGQLIDKLDKISLFINMMEMLR